jgi:hypothetical protein
VSEEVGGAGFTFFQPTYTSTENCTGGCLGNQSIKFNTKGGSSSTSQGIVWSVSSTMLGLGQPAFQRRDLRTATTGRGSSIISSKWRDNDFRSVPRKVGAKRRKGWDCRRLQFRGRKQGGVEAPEERGRKRRGMGKGDDKSIMITSGARYYPSVHSESRMTTVGKNMIKASMHIHARVVKGVVSIRSSIKCSIKKGGEARLEVWPCAMGGWRRGGGTVQDWIWVSVPVTRKKVKGGKIRRLSRKRVEESVAGGTSSRGVNVNNREGPPLVAKGRR